MARRMAAVAQSPGSQISVWNRLGNNRNWLGFWFMVPAAAFLILFLTYPLGLGMWLSFFRAWRSGVGVNPDVFRRSQSRRVIAKNRHLLRLTSGSKTAITSDYAAPAQVLRLENTRWIQGRTTWAAMEAEG